MYVAILNADVLKQAKDRSVELEAWYTNYRVYIRVATASLGDTDAKDLK